MDLGKDIHKFVKTGTTGTGKNKVIKLPSAKVKVLFRKKVFLRIFDTSDLPLRWFHKNVL